MIPLAVMSPTPTEALKSTAFKTLTSPVIKGFGTWQHSDWENVLAPLPTIYSSSREHVSAKNEDGETIFEMRLTPSDIGSARNSAQAFLPASRNGYETIERVKFTPGFDWGREQKAAKISLAGIGMQSEVLGQTPGGSLDATDGFSLRLMYSGTPSVDPRFAGYYYGADKVATFGNSGEYLYMPDSPLIERDRWYTIRKQVIPNTSFDAFDGIIRIWVDDVLYVEETDRRMLSSGDLDRNMVLIHDTFWGGASLDFAGNVESFVQYGLPQYRELGEEVPTETTPPPSLQEWGATLTGSTATVHVLHPEGSTGWRYDVQWRVKGQTEWNDPFTSQVFGGALEYTFTGIPTDGSTLEFSIVDWLGDFATNNRRTIGELTAHTFVAPTGSLTFAEIRSAAEATREPGGPTWDWRERDTNGNFTTAWSIDKHVAAFYYLHPNVDYHEVNGETIVIVPTPTAPSDVRTLPAPTGGEDADDILSFINANAPHKTFTGLGRNYQISNLILPAGVQIWDMPSSGCTATRAHRVINTDVRYYNCPVSSPSSGTQMAWELEGTAHRCHIVQGGFSDVNHTSNLNVCGVFIDDAPEDIVISRLVCSNLDNNGSTTTSAARMIWGDGGNTSATPSGRISNCEGENFSSNGTTQDAELINIQFYQGSAGKLLIAANKHRDAGKRITKLQDAHGVRAYFNSGVWTKTSVATAQFVLAAIDLLAGSSDIDASMNFLNLGSAAGPENIISFTNATAQHNVHVDFNDIRCDAGISGASNQGIQIMPSNYTGNSSILGNWVYGNGRLEHHYYHRGSPDVNDLDRTGTRFDVPFTISEIRTG